MALNYQDLETLRPQLLPRIRQAVTKYFLFLIGGGGTPAANQLDWVKANIVNVASIAEQLSHYVMSETAFIDNGTSITDAQIQSRIEAVINSELMPAAV